MCRANSTAHSAERTALRLMTVRMTPELFGPTGQHAVDEAATVVRSAALPITEKEP
jgi:hypothetical protein